MDSAGTMERRAEPNTPEAEEKRKIISFLRLILCFVIHISPRLRVGGAAQGHELEKDGLATCCARVRERR